MGQAVVFVASDIVDFSAYLPEDLVFLQFQYIVQDLNIFRCFQSSEYAFCISFDFAMKVRWRKSGCHGYQWCVKKKKKMNK